MEPDLRVLTSPTQPQASLHAREKANLLLRTVTFWSCQFINLRILTLREKEGFEPWSEVQRLYGTQLFVNLRKSDAEGKYKAQTSRVKSFLSPGLGLADLVKLTWITIEPKKGKVQVRNSPYRISEPTRFRAI